VVGPPGYIGDTGKSFGWPGWSSREGTMTELLSLPPPPGTHFAGSKRRHFVPARPDPRKNHLLAALSQQEYQRLLPELEPFPLPVGLTLHDAGGCETYLYFITAGLVSRFTETASGASAEFAVTGSEGVIGLVAFLGGESTTSRAIVLSAGHSYRLRADRLQQLEHDGPLPRLLLRYTRTLIAQIGQVAACNRHHMLEQRLCRWILCCLDRMPGNELAFTQELIANILGVRREGVTEAVGRLQKAGAIHCTRGHVVVLDRRRLEARVCECYAVIKREYNGLLADYCQAEAPSWAHPVTRVPAFIAH
jgi:CRP-like cAMP-binding protein